MPTQTPKHKRVLRDGQTSRGPARWARAAGNAFTNPNSKAGQLYLKRTTHAYTLTLDSDFSKVQPYAHVGEKWTFNYSEGRREYTVTDTIKYYTCSPFCAAMVVQLDHTGEVYEFSSLYFFMSNDDRAPRPGTPTRTVRCYCCGSDIKS